MSARVAFAITALLAVSASAWAAPADQAGQTPPVVTDQIIVTANRLEDRLANVPAAVDVITAEQIQRSSAKTLDEVLKLIPGFSLLRQGASLVTSPQTRSTSLRGLGGSSSSRTLVLVDDVPINSSVTGAVFWPAISLDNVERIEIVRSAAGVWGNLAIGGVINVITKSPKPGEPAASVSLEGGTQSSGRVQAALRRFVGPFGISASSSFLTTDGFVTVRADRIGPIDRTVSDAIKTFNAKIESRTPRRNWSLGGSYYKEHQLQGTPLSLNDVGIGSIHGGAEFISSLGGRLRLVGFARRQTATTVNTSIATDRLSETPSSSQDGVPADAAGGSVLWSRLIARRHLVGAGIDTEWTRGVQVENFQYSTTTKGFTRVRNEGGQQIFGGVFVEDLFQVTPRWRLTAAMRLDGWSARGAFRRETETTTGAVLRDDVYPNYGVTAFDPSVGTVVRASNKVYVRAAINRAFRAPFPNELYHPFRSRGGVITESNPALVPERLLGVETGVDVTVASRLSVHLTGFSNRLDDPVINATIGAAGSTAKTIPPCGSVQAFGVCRQQMNAGRLSSAGADLGMELRPVPGLELDVSYMFNRSRIVAAEGQPQLVGKFNRQSPVNQGVIQASYSRQRFARVSVAVRLVGSRFDDDINSVVIAPLMSIDVNVTRDVSTRAAAYVAIQNATDRVNELTHSDDGTYSIVGPRQINAGLRLRF